MLKYIKYLLHKNKKYYVHKEVKSIDKYVTPPQSTNMFIYCRRLWYASIHLMLNYINTISLFGSILAIGLLFKQEKYSVDEKLHETFHTYVYRQQIYCIWFILSLRTKL